MDFGRLDKLDRRKVDVAVEAVLAYGTSPKVPMASDLERRTARDYGDMLALFDVAELIEVMVLNCIGDPLSKLGVMGWLFTVYILELKEGQVSYLHLFRAMDYLVERSLREEGLSWPSGFIPGTRGLTASRLSWLWL